MKTETTCLLFRKYHEVKPGFSVLCLLLVVGFAVMALPVLAGEVTTAPENPAEAEKADKPPKDDKEGIEEKKPADSWWLTGYNKLKYRFRYTREDTDHDVYDTISLTMKDRKKDPLYKFHVHARGVVDIGGRLKPGQYHDFRDLYDRYGSHAHGDLYSLYMDFNELCPYGSKIRLGRQRVYEAEGVTFDGAKVEMALSEKKLFWSIFGGGSVHRYEENHHDDNVVGTGLRYKASKKFQVRTEFVRATDERADQPLEEEPAENLYFLSAKWNLSKQLKFYGRLSWIDSNQPREPFQPRRYLLRVSYKDPDSGLVVKFTGVSQRHTIQDITTEFNDFVSTMHEYHPYYQGKLYIYKEFSETLATEITYSQRELRYPQRDEGVLNHEFGEGTFALVLSDLLGNGSEFTVEASYFDTKIDDIATWGFDWTMPWTETTKTSIGSEFSRYKYDIYNEIEREGVRSVYGELIYKLSKKWRFTLKWEWESDDFDIYNTATVGLKYKF